MKFTTQKQFKSVDFTKLKENDVASATLKSFNYINELCFGTFISGGASVRAILGTRVECPIKDMIPLKGIEVEVTYGGINHNNGVDYPKFWISY